MEKKYTFWERIISNTPTFFKRMQLFGISLAGLGTSLSQITNMPEKLTTILIAVGSTITVLAQFAVKQYELLND